MGRRQERSKPGDAQPCSGDRIAASTSTAWGATRSLFDIAVGSCAVGEGRSSDQPTLPVTQYRASRKNKKRTLLTAAALLPLWAEEMLDLGSFGDLND
jgi:hypothetical protein